VTPLYTDKVSLLTNVAVKHMKHEILYFSLMYILLVLSMMYYFLVLDTCRVTMATDFHLFITIATKTISTMLIYI